MKPLTILQITNRLPWPLNDGGNLATYNVTRHLHELGHKVVLASLNTNKHKQDPAVLSHVAEVHAVELNTDLSKWGLLKGFFQQMPYNVARFDDPRFKSLLLELVKRENPDVIQVEGSYQALFVPALRAVTNAPIVLRSHNVEWRIWQRLYENETNWLKKQYLGNLYKKIRWFEETTLDRFDGVIAITEEDANWYRSQGFKGKVECIQAGADLTVYQPGNQWAPSQKVGFIGSMEWQPNVQGVRWFVDEVWAKVLEAAPDAELHLAGKHPPAWMEDWKVERMQFHGMVPDATEFLQGFHIFIVPLLSGSGMRLKIVEALAMKKCVLSTSVGAEGIDVVNEKDLLIADGPAEFAAGLIRLLEDETLSRQLAEQGYAQIRSGYDWKRLILRFVDFYHQFK